MKLSLIDFKNHGNSEYELEGDIVIEGKNGEGKTSILEGIVFTLFGRNFYGKLGTDVFIKDGAPCATTIVNLGDVEIKRTQGEDNSVYLNGSKSKVAEIGSLFPSVETALPIINPLYFIYEMSDLDKRDLFMKLLPPIDREEMFKKHFSKDETMVARFKNSSLRGLRDQISSNEAVLKANVSQVATYGLDIKSREDEIKQLRKTIPEMPEGVLEDEKDTQKKLEQAQRELGLMGNPNVRVAEYDKELEGLKEKVKPILEKLQVSNISNAIEKLDGATKELQEQVEESKKKIAQGNLILEQLEQFKEGKCPLCKQPVSGAQDRIEETQKELDQEGEIVLQLKEKLLKYESVLRTLNDARENVARCINGKDIYEKKVPKYEKLIKDIKEYEKNLVGNSKKDFEDAVERERKREQVKLIQNEIMRKKGTIARLEETNAKLRKDLPDLQLLEKALSNKGVDAYIAKEHAKEIEKLIKEYMDVEVVTVLENKTNDNTKEVFEVTKNGVSFRSMSFGEKVKLSIAFGLVLRKLARGFNLPFVLLDEASVLSKGTLTEIKDWLAKENVNLIYTRATDTKLIVKKD